MSRKVWIGLSTALLLTTNTKLVLADTEQPFLDAESKRIITSRVCKKYLTQEYTQKELLNYTWDNVSDNINRVDTSENNILANNNAIRNNHEIRSQTYLIMIDVLKTCYPSKTRRKQ